MRKRTIEIANRAEVHRVTEIFGKRSSDVRSRIAPTLKGLYNPTRILEPIKHTIDFENRLIKPFPQFEEVIDYFKTEALMSQRLKLPFKAAPVLLVGPPGLGKTYFSFELAKQLDLPWHQIDMANLTANFTISGSSTQWGEGEPGCISNFLSISAKANLVVTLDEIDKVSMTNRYDPMAAFYSLLEPHTAKKFRDEALNIELDVSNFIWIATANDVLNIPSPILSRFKQFEIKQPSPEKMIGVIESIYTNRLTHFGFAKLLSANLLDQVKEKLSKLTPREVRIALDYALTRALFNESDHVRLVDLPVEKMKVRSVGFY